MFSECFSNGTWIEVNTRRVIQSSKTTQGETGKLRYCCFERRFVLGWFWWLIKGIYSVNQATSREQSFWFHLRWLNTDLAVCGYMLFAKPWQEKGFWSQAETWQVKNVLMKDFDWRVKMDVFLVSMATWTIEYNLKISLFLSLDKIRSLDFPINLHTAY